jgi:protein-tyrosine phosphatase
VNRVIVSLIFSCLLIFADAEAAQKQVLFICTGNYYRSRFAEALFNQKVGEAHLDWHAISRGLNLVPWQLGISKYAQQELTKRGVTKALMTGGPKRLTKQDVMKSDRIIVMDEAEHRSLFERNYSVANVQYWHIPDVGKLKAPQACALMSDNIEQLISELTRK